MIARLAAAAAVLALVLTGCGSDEPSSEEQAGPDVPAYAQNGGRDGAEQFVGYWVTTLNQVLESGDIKKLYAISSRSCQMCGSYMKGIDDIYDAGGHVETRGWDIRGITHEGGGSDARQVMVITVRISPQTVYRDDKSKAEKHDGGEARYRVVLRRAGESWKLLDLAPSR